MSQVSSPSSQSLSQSDHDSRIIRPNHYARYIIEPITFINANQLPFNIANVIKYVCRYDAKNGIEDLEKAKRYIDIQIECMRRHDAIKGCREDMREQFARDVWSTTL